MVTTINLYKYAIFTDDTGSRAIVYRYTVPNLDNLAISYNTPISPMPLPEENAKENVLVKIEGNSATVDIDWSVIDELSGKFAYSIVQTGNLMGEYNDESVRGKFDPVNLDFTSDATPTPFGGVVADVSTPEKQVRAFLDYFESKSIDNDFLLTIHDDREDDANLSDDGGYGTAADPMRFYGSVAQMTFNITGMSPVIYKARLQFFMGNVITVFDADTPEKPRNLGLVNETTGTGTNTQHTIKVRFQDPANFGGSDINKVTVAYRLEGEMSWRTTVWGVTSGTNGDSTHLEKLTSGGDSGYYVVKIPTPSQGANGVDNYNLDSSGNFIDSGYPPSGNNTTNSFTPLRPYKVKIYFHNSSGSGTEIRQSQTTGANNA
jgi:hypothetical protein